MLPPQRSPKSRAFLTTSAVSLLRNELGRRVGIGCEYRVNNSIRQLKNYT
jgi:hypothetical protein